MTDANLMCEAAATGDVEAVRVLLEKDPALVHAHSRDGWTPLHLAAHGGHRHVVEALLAGGADVQAPADNSLASTPLLWAISGQDLETVMLLLAHGADVNSASKAGSTPLHKAAVLGNVAMVQLLLTHDAQVNARNSGGQTPLTHALYNRHEDVAMLLRRSEGRE